MAMAMAMTALGRRLHRNSINNSFLALLPAALTPPCTAADSLNGLFVESAAQADSNMPQLLSNNSWRPLFGLSRSIFSVSSTCRPLDPGSAISPSIGSADMRVSGCIACTGFAKAIKSRSKAVGWGHFYQQASMSSAGQELDTHDDFKPVQKSSNTIPSVHEHIEKDIKENSVLVYMKGVPEAPQCGFSAMVVRVLQQYDVPFKSRNVLADQELREGIKAFSNWPTIPQVFINGEFVGGSDILINMHRSGELEAKLKEVKSASTTGES